MKENRPRHVAFIMDGNGRWARRRGLPRIKGHERGAKTVRRLLEELVRLEIPEATFYALSCENFERRPGKEIKRLLDLLMRYLEEEKPLLCREKIRLVVIGRLRELPEEVRKRIRKTEAESADHDRLLFRLAVNYGSRQEIWDGVRKLLKQVRIGELSERKLNRWAPDDFRRFLYDPEMTDPDLLIRTGGQQRLSNFLLWQLSYAELYMTDVLWPSFGVKQLHLALAKYARSTRKFGAVK